MDANSANTLKYSLVISCDIIYAAFKFCISYLQLYITNVTFYGIWMIVQIINNYTDYNVVVSGETCIANFLNESYPSLSQCILFNDPFVHL